MCAKFQTSISRKDVTAHFSRRGRESMGQLETTQLMNRLHKDKHLDFFYYNTFTYYNKPKEHTVT